MGIRHAVLTVSAAAVLVTPGAAAGAVTPRISGPSPYASCVTAAPEGAVLHPGAEVEPDVSANPARAGNLVAVWQQDRWSDGGAHGLAAGYSLDGGRTWHETTLPFSACAPGGAPYNRASDPAVSFGPDGTAYAIGLSFDQTTPRDAITSSVSTDGGRTWSAPVAITADTGNGLDKEWITADPVHAGTAYAVWDNLTITPDGHYRGPAYFSKTTDHGRTWTTPQAIAATGEDEQSLGNQILVDRRTGRLYDTYAFYSCLCARIPTVAYVTSDDGGRTWSPQRVVASMVTAGVVQPGTGAPVRSGGFPVAAVGPSGRVYVAWQDARFSGGSYDEIAVAATGDRGAHWTAPHRASTPTGRPAFVPSIAVSPYGTVAVTYFDLRHDDVTDEPLTTDHWATTSSDGVRFTADRHLAGPFDLAAAPNARGYFVGDYMGVTGTGPGFVAVFARTNCTGEACPDNRTDIYSARFPAGSGPVLRTPARVRSFAVERGPGAHRVR